MLNSELWSQFAPCFYRTCYWLVECFFYHWTEQSRLVSQTVSIYHPVTPQRQHIQTFFLFVHDTHTYTRNASRCRNANSILTMYHLTRTEETEPDTVTSTRPVQNCVCVVWIWHNFTFVASRVRKWPLALEKNLWIPDLQYERVQIMVP
jgi:hypothetical protein